MNMYDYNTLTQLTLFITKLIQEMGNV